MLFNSFDFGFFLVIVYGLYWALGSRRRITQNVLLLVASYVFYGLWDWRFLGLLAASSLVDFGAAYALSKTRTPWKRQLLLWSSVGWNLGVLIAFKYFHFFLSEFYTLFHIQVPEGSFTIWTILIPVGLSFYTFQTLGYTIDVYRGKQPATQNALQFFCFVSFFPQLVAGPIERAKKLLPQFQEEREFVVSQQKEGLRQILWGLLKKILVADTLGIAVTTIFEQPEAYGSLSLVYAAVLFSFQMYGDFSGYTDIAIGTAKLFGFRLSRNFNLPYLAKSISEFWQRWHITLTNWFTVYVYAPLVRYRKRQNFVASAMALLVTMTLIGFWHGANWTFICFGIFNGIILIVERIPLRSTQSIRSWLSKQSRFFSLIYFFTLTSISSIFFRATSIDDAWVILQRIVSLSEGAPLSTIIGWKLLVLPAMIGAELIFRKNAYPMQELERWLPKPARWALYYLFIFLLVRYAAPQEAFIYFQF
ncbi:MBOAT family O-acyltransferase [Altibacter sp. HG106]|uniref:MBOAT family O-acyltransferase n=1 Tax=Altibacter sp. HG106 TaxID=3023937 RepID=UPI002350D312|nr:MBOAT family O-acyltransferase [Altibacter sp. HG106]MDC7995297.1 MBOAT family protein [Altibacter sp. HG106]